MKRNKQHLAKIINDLKLISEWQGVTFSCKEARRLIRVNFDRFVLHINKNGDVSEFQYE